MTEKHDEDAVDLVDVTERWLRDVKIKAMWNALTMVGIKYPKKIELLGDLFYLSESALNKIVRVRRTGSNGDNDSTVNKQ